MSRLLMNFPSFCKRDVSVCVLVSKRHLILSLNLFPATRGGTSQLGCVIELEYYILFFSVPLLRYVCLRHGVIYIFCLGC